MCVVCGAVCVVCCAVCTVKTSSGSHLVAIHLAVMGVGQEGENIGGKEGQVKYSLEPWFVMKGQGVKWYEGVVGIRHQVEEDVM